jgi:hypothetical protein
MTLGKKGITYRHFSQMPRCDYFDQRVGVDWLTNLRTAEDPGRNGHN